MSKLYLRINRLSNDKRNRANAWPVAEAGVRDCSPARLSLCEAQAQEFAYCESHGKPEVLGAGGQYAYRVYDRLGDVDYPYAVVLPHHARVREDYPGVCRVVNIRTGQESALLDNHAEALELIELAKQGKLLGSFDLDPR